MIALGFVLIYKATETGNTVAEIGAGLASLGFQPGQVASVLANTCREWVWADLAIQTMGGVCNGIYPTDAAAQVEYLCVDSDSCFLFVEDDEQLDKQRLTAEDEELTPTMKLKRSLINRKYAALIEGMYSVKAAT